MNKNVKIVLGGKWGDEGKGKIASRESKDAKLVIRATGGANAGHTIVFCGKKIALHLVPGGIVYPQTTCLIGQGVVLDIPILMQEISNLEKMGVPNVRERLKISGRTHLIFPYHKSLDELHEKMKDKPIGTTKRGIGPCYADKDNRVGLRVYDLLLSIDKLEKKFEEAVKLHNQLFMNNGMEDSVVDVKKLALEYHEYGKMIESMIVNADVITREAIDNNDKIVIEGAQAYRLDKDYGDYPNVTSSNCVTTGTLIGAHIPYNAVGEAIVVVKGYDTRVGNGPFPTEQDAHVENDVVLDYDVPYIGDLIRELGHEYGATTNRPRRCGWFDAVMLKSCKYAMGVDSMCINHMDTLGEIGNKLGYINICTGYNYQGNIIDYYPDDIELTGEVPTPIYTTIEGGWSIDSNIRNYADLPQKMKDVIDLIEKHTGIFVKFIGIGPDNEDLVVRDI